MCISPGSSTGRAARAAGTSVTWPMTRPPASATHAHTCGSASSVRRCASSSAAAGARQPAGANAR